MKKILKKPLFIILAILVLFILGLVIFSKKKTPYDLVIAKKGNITQEVSVTGRIKSAESVDLAFEKGGTVKTLFADIGQKVEAGALLVQLDASDAEKQVRDTEIALENARLALDKLKLEQEQQLRGDTLNKSYEEGLVILSHLYDEFGSTLDALDRIFFDTNLDGKRSNIAYYASYSNEFVAVPARVEKLYQEVKELHQQGVLDYQLAERGGGEARNKAIQSGYALTVKTAEMIKTGRDTIRSLQDYLLANNSTHIKQEIIDSHANNLSAYAASINNYLKDLLAISNTVSAQLDKTNTYSLDIKSQELLIRQREHALEDAKDNLKKYSLRSPINGVVTKQNFKVGEIVSPAQTAVSVISEAQYEIETFIPEADIAKVKINDPTKVTLDAYGPDVVFEAKVAKIDPAETIIEGVASYKVVLQLEKEDERIKSGMTANIDILTASRENVVIIPEKAIFTKNSDKFVRIVSNQKEIKEVLVKTGLRGIDGNVEILEGVSIGDKIITSLKIK